MPVTGPPNAEKITAAQFNTLVSLYNAYWQGGSYSYDTNHSSELVRRKGWGQPAVIPTVASHTLITAEHTNYLLTQINAGLWHIEEDVSFLQVKRSSSTSISATLYNQLEDVYNNTIEPKKFNIDPSSKNVNTAIVTTSNSSTPWPNDLYSEHKFVFTDYNKARHFFNSGGELIIDMSSTAGDTNPPSLAWNSFFENLGIVRIGAETTTNDGDGEGDGPYSSLGGAKGFYSITGVDNGTSPTNDDWVIVYNVAADDYVESANSNGGYNSPGGIYSQRRFQIELRGTVNTSPNQFEIHVKIKLMEDDEDGSSINTNITGEFGFSQPLNTPDPSDVSGNSLATYFSPANGVDYIFAERTAPLISQVTPWTLLTS